MNILVSDILNFLKSEIENVYGNPQNLFVRHLQPSKKVDEYTLDWIGKNNNKKQEIAEKSKAKVIITDSSVVYSDNLRSFDKVIIIVENPKLAIAKIGNEFFVKKRSPFIHPTAILHSELVIGKDGFVGANAIVGKCNIGDFVNIGEGVKIADGVNIGNHVVIKPGAVLGYEGFGFERLEDGNLIKFPQLGGLIIEDYVEIGSNTCIDRGSLSDTIIGKGSKINNLCHIAHNVVIGENVIITAQVNISGSSFIDDNVWIAPNATLRGHQKIGTRAIIGSGAVVTKDVPAFETWIGNPAKKIN